MKNLIKFEFRKLFKSKLFYICGIILIASIFIEVGTNQILYKQLQDTPFAFENTTTVLDTLKTVNSLMPIILAVFVCIFVCDDYTSDTIKNIYAKGYTKKSIFFSKYLVTLIVTLMFLAVDFILKFIFGVMTYNEFGNFSMNYLFTLLAVMLIMICYQTFYFMLTITIRKLALSIAGSIIVPSIVELILTLFDLLVFKKTVTAYYSLDGRLMLLQSGTVASMDLIISFIYEFVFVGVFLLAAFFINKKKD